MVIAATAADELAHEPEAHLTRNGVGIILSIGESVSALVGWAPDQMVGKSSTHFIHPDDQASAVAAWVTMLDAPDGAGFWRGRYRTAEGGWVWVETINHLQEGEPAIVHTTMRAIVGDQASTEERLHERSQMLSRLSDALPVGVFQFDLVGRVTFTNDRLHSILGIGPRPTIDEQLEGIVAQDRTLFELAIDRALTDQPVADVEIRIQAPRPRRGGSGTGECPDDADVAEQRVCLLSLRTLTDTGGEVSGAVGCLTDTTERAHLRQELELRATFDSLTSCLNRAATIEMVSRTINAMAGASGHAVVFIDLDQFKSVNDDMGHAAGDRLLVMAVDLLRLAIRDGDHIGRLGGDEFLVICPGVDAPAQAADIAGRIARALSSTVELDAGSVQLRASVGVAWTGESLDADTLIARADIAMYESKRLGGSAATLIAGPENQLLALAV
jgi:diguanylate cyclase (GGDEF)-like protein/PAS domain S-box-containing protein